MKTKMTHASDGCSVITLFLAALTAVGVTGCDVGSNGPSISTAIENQVVEISCGQCQLGMEGDGCDLTIRHQGKSYLVEGSNIDDHGDAHAEDGLCNCVRSAQVTGELKKGVFHVSEILVLETEPKE